MTTHTDQQPDRRERYAKALRECGIYDSEERLWRSLSPEWVEEIITAVLAVVDTEPTAELLALAAVLEIPRSDSGLPIQLRRSYGHTDRWAICDGMYGRRWHREHGWVYEQQGIRDEAQRNSTRFPLAEAVPLARQLANPGHTADETHSPTT